jgi:chromosome partitioning protein
MQAHADGAAVYAVVNQKGGVGKTTTAVNLAAFMALAGRRVLLVDLDPQGNATSGVGIDKQAVSASTYDVLIDDRSIESTVMETRVEGLFVLPSTLDLAGADVQLMSRIARESVLRRVLDPIRGAYDVILIDAPPSLGLLTLNALVAADSVIIPIQTEYYALEGISQLLKTIDLIKRNMNASLDIALVVLTMYDTRTRLGQQVAEEVRKFFGARVSSTTVPRNVRLSEAPSYGRPIALYDPRSRGAVAYRRIAEEVLANGKERPR